MDDTDAHAALPEANREQQYHLRTFCGRQALLADIAARLARPAGSVLLLLGGPGTGKSALAAALAERHAAPLHMIKSHRNPARFVPSLIAQARARTAPSHEPHAQREALDLDDLRSELARALTALRDVRGSAVVVIDALDELHDTAALAFLPMHLPDGVHLVLTARPDIPLTTALRARLADLDELQVPPLEVADVRAQCEAVGLGSGGAVDAEQLTGRTRGNALLVARALELARRTGALDVSAVAATVGHLFDQVYREIAERGGRVALRVIQLLAIAYEPLSVAELAELLELETKRDRTTPEQAVSLERCRGVVDTLSEHLLSDGAGGFQPWHQGLSDFIRTDVLGEGGVLAKHTLFAELCAQAKLGTRADAYALRHRVKHALACGQPDEARAHAEDIASLERKLSAGLAADCVLDLERVASPFAFAVRRHAHLLTRRPTALCAVLDYEMLLPKATCTSAAESPWLKTLQRPTSTRSERFVLRGHTDEVLSIAVDAAGARIASASADGTLRIWDAHSTLELACARLSAKRALSVAFSPNGRTVACGTDDGGAVVLEVGIGAELWRTSSVAPVWAVAFSPAGLLATGSRDGSVSLWDEAGRALWRASAGCVVTSLSFSPDGRSLFATGTRGRLVFWSAHAADWGSAASEPIVAASSDDETLWAVAHAKASDRLVVAGSDGTLRLVGPGAQLIAETTVESERLYAAAINRDGTLVACGGTSGRLHVFGERAGELVLTASLPAHSGWVDAIAFGPTEGMLVSCSTDGTIRGCVVPHEQPAAEGGAASPSAVAVTSHGKQIAVGHFDGSLAIWSAHQPAELSRVAAHDGRILALAFDPADRLLASASLDGSARLFKIGRAAGDGLRIARVATLVGHDAAVTAIRFAPQAGRVATGSRDQTVRIWSVFGSREVLRLEHDDTVTHLAFCDRGAFLAAASQSSIRVWSLESSALVLQAKGVGPVEQLELDVAAVRLRTRSGAWSELRFADNGQATPADPWPAQRLELLSGRVPRAATLGIAAYESAVVDGVQSVGAAYPVAFSAVCVIPASSTKGLWAAIDATGLFVLELTE